MKRAVVTGGAGFVGTHLCEELVRQGVRVVCVDDFSTGRRSNIAHLLEGHPEQFQLVEHDVSTGIPVTGTVDAVFHMASPAAPHDYARLPLETLRVGSFGTHAALALAAEHEAHFLLASTSEVYGDPQVHPQPEEYWGNVSSVGPRSAYDEAKRFGEALTVAYSRVAGVSTSIVRIFNTYGPGMRVDDGRAIPAFVNQALRGEPLTVAGNGQQTRSLCYVDDLVRGLLEVAEARLPGPVNLGNPNEVSVQELALTIRDLADSDSPIVHVQRPLHDPQVRCPDITHVSEALGWRPEISLQEGLRRTIRAYDTLRKASAPGAVELPQVTPETTYHEPIAS